MAARRKPAPARVSLHVQREAERQQWEAIKGAFVESAWRGMMRNPWAKYYAYLKPSAPGQWGELRAIPDGEPIPDGFMRAARAVDVGGAEYDRPIPGGTREQIRFWLERFAGRLPVYPMEKRP